MENIKEGDTVELKSGYSPFMTVTYISYSREAKLIWFDNNNCLQSTTISVDFLKKTRRTRPGPV